MIHIDSLLVNEKYNSFEEYIKAYYETIRLEKETYYEIKKYKIENKDLNLDDYILLDNLLSNEINKFGFVDDYNQDYYKKYIAQLNKTRTKIRNIPEYLEYINLHIKHDFYRVQSYQFNEDNFNFLPNGKVCLYAEYNNNIMDVVSGDIIDGLNGKDEFDLVVNYLKKECLFIGSIDEHCLEEIRIYLSNLDINTDSLSDYTYEELIDMGYEDIDIFMEDVPHKSCELAYNIRKNITRN